MWKRNHSLPEQIERGLVMNENLFRPQFDTLKLSDILYADTLQYENGAKLSRDEQENLKCLYQHFVLNREDFIDWDI